MKILLTGANGYIGMRLLPVLLEAGHEVICCVRNRQRFDHADLQGNYRIWEVDFLNPVPEDAPADI
ncbi:MAG: NAD-dependent epimerase/dehydratase family protein, partial [Lewinella sp.]|nr:NAD-dependent epimerase/dehydratase family protein [Lewinella sp.]